MKPCYECARAGDAAATNQVVDSLRPRLSRMATHYARVTGEDADDLLQEAWVGLLDALPVLDLNIGQPDQYLIQRARWRLLDAVKRAAVRRCSPLDETVDDLPCEKTHAPVHEACVTEFAGTLKPTQQKVLGGLLAGMTWREVGDALGCTSANVAYHVRQIRAQYITWDEG